MFLTFINVRSYLFAHARATLNRYPAQGARDNPVFYNIGFLANAHGASQTHQTVLR